MILRLCLSRRIWLPVYYFCLFCTGIKKHWLFGIKNNIFKIYLFPILKKSLEVCNILASILIIQIIRPYFKQSYIYPLHKHINKDHVRKERDLSSDRFKDYRRTGKKKHWFSCFDPHFSLTHLHLLTLFQLLSHHHQTILLFPETSVEFVIMVMPIFADLLHTFIPLI